MLLPHKRHGLPTLATHRYKDLGSLNSAWGTTFWSQRYTAWEEIDAPRANHTVVNPAQRLDFARFSSDESLACFTLQRDILRAANPSKPITTNFMTTNCKSMDLWRWAREVDVVSNDHYLNADEPDNHINLAMSADLSRSLKQGQPWLLMEHSTGALSWQPRNIAKRPDGMRRNSLAHVARGSDSVLFFQWGQSRFGAEKFHSAMLPQAGTDGLPNLARRRGARQRTAPAEGRPRHTGHRRSSELRAAERFEPDLGEAPAKNLRTYVESGGHLLVSYFSGIVDEPDTVHEVSLLDGIACAGTVTVPAGGVRVVRVSGG